jgi:hypothetical protein
MVGFAASLLMIPIAAAPSHHPAAVVHGVAVSQFSSEDLPETEPDEVVLSTSSYGASGGPTQYIYPTGIPSSVALGTPTVTFTPAPTVDL